MVVVTVRRLIGTPVPRLIILAIMWSSFLVVPAAADEVTSSLSRGSCEKVGPLLLWELKEQYPNGNGAGYDPFDGEDSGDGTLSRNGSSAANEIIKVIVVMDSDHLFSLPDNLLDELEDRVVSLGGYIGDHAFNNVQVWLPPDKIEVLAEWAAVRLIKKPTPVEKNGTTTGTVGFVGAEGWHQAGITGKGVKVGIIDMGFYGYQSLLGTELPAHVEVASTGEPASFYSYVHGSACAEIVHDMAPDAGIMLVNVDDIEVDFHRAVQWMKGNGARIVSSSIGLNLKTYVTMLYYMLNGSSLTATYYQYMLENLEQTKDQWNYVIRNAVADGITWVQAAGNDGRKKWLGWYFDWNHNNLLDFYYGDDFNRIHTSGYVGEEVYVALLWGESTDMTTYSDYDLYIVDQYGNTVASSRMMQSYLPLGLEACRFTVQRGREYYIAVQNYAAYSQELVLLIGHENFPNLEHYDPDRTVNMNCPSNHPDVITVGAVHPDDTQPYGVTIASYSSQGPAGNMIKPDLVAPSGVATASYGNAFYGTSAAAPHVAGMCALIKQKNPSWGPVKIRNYLEENAVDLGAPGKDNVYGSGLARLPALVTSLPPVAGFTLSPVAGYAPLTVSFFNASQNSGQCRWDFGDGTTATELNPTHIYSQPGTYTILLKVWANTIGAGTDETASQVVVLPAVSDGNAVIDPVGGEKPLVQNYYWPYGMVSSPFLHQDPALCKPWAVTDLSSTSSAYEIGFPAFTAPVDIYLAIQSDELVNGSLLVVKNRNGMPGMDPELVPWKVNVTGTVCEPLQLPLTQFFPAGTYNLFAAVVPVGETDFSRCYLWSSSYTRY